MLRRIELKDRSDFILEGAAPYERILARVFFAVDPADRANQIISDIALAPRNGNGLVEFSADLCILKPRDPARGNGTLLFEVLNRGYTLAGWMFNRGAPSPEPQPKEFGDGFLFTQGFTIAWLGWQPDLPQDPRLLRLRAPIATEQGRPITGLIRAEFVASDRKSRSFSLGDSGHIPYAVSDPADRRIQLSVRESGYAARRVLPRSEWQFAREENGKAVPDLTSVLIQAGLEPGLIYEVVYPAKDPVVIGLGSAGVRDLVSFLKFGGPEAATTLLGDQPRYIKRAICFGASQSGRFVRSFLHDGFNRDKQGRRVFDGMWAHLAGPARGSFNHRFAQPSRGSDPHVNFDYPTFLPPFDDVLSKARQDRVVPKIFFTNTSYEYWGYGASLLQSTSPDTRIYSFAGSQHVPAPAPGLRVGTRYVTNHNDFHWCLRALLLALNRWVTDGGEPPPSRYPHLESHELIRFADYAFPHVPGVEPPSYQYPIRRIDLGPEFEKRRIVTIEPPKVGEPYAVFVPRIDADGNERDGVLSPEVSVPLGTFTGWNLRDPATGAPKTLAANWGAFFAFAKTRSDRINTGDPRLSIEERYRDRASYLARISTAARELVKQGFLLDRDVPRIVEQAGSRWDALLK